MFVRIYFASLFSVLRKQKRRIRLCKYDSKSVTFSGSTRWVQILYFSNVLETEILTLKGGKRVNRMGNQAATYANILFNVLFFFFGKLYTLRLCDHRREHLQRAYYITVLVHYEICTHTMGLSVSCAQTSLKLYF